MTRRLARRLPPLPVAAAALAIAAALLGDAMLYVVMPARPQAWGLTIALVGVLLSANRLIRLLSNPLAGLAFQRLGTTVPFAVAMAVAVVVTATYGWVTAFWALLLARVTWGFCWSVLRMGGQWAVLDAASDANRGLLMGSYSGIVRLGSLGGALLGGLLSDVVSHRFAFTLFAALTAAAGLGWYTASGRRAAARAPVGGHGSGGGLRDVVADARLLVMSTGSFASGLVFSGILGASLGFLFRARYGEEVPVAAAAIGVATFTGLVLGARSVLDAVLAPVAGHVADRLGRRRAIVGSLLVAAAGLAALAAVSHVWLMVAAVMAAFAASVGLSVQLVTAAGDLAAPARRAAVLSTYATFQDLGAAIGPLLGLSWGSLGTLRLLFVGSAAALALLAAAAARTLPREALAASAARGPACGGAAGAAAEGRGAGTHMIERSDE